MKYSLLVFFVLLINSFTYAQSTYFIKYKDYVDKSEIEYKVNSQQFLPEHASYRLAASEFRVNYLARGIAKHDQVLGRIIKVSFRNNFDESVFMQFSQLDPDIEYIQPSVTYQMHNLPNDSLVSEQWALEKIKAFDAWEITMGEDSVLVAVIDTGIDYLHPDLSGQIWLNPGELGTDAFGNDKRSNGVDDDNNGFIDDYMGWDFTDRQGFPFDTSGGDYLGWDNDPMDENSFSHGTAVSGIIAAKTNNFIGIAGAAPNIRIMNLRAFDPAGFGEEDDVAAAIIYAVEMGAKVINMSFGDTQFSLVLRDVIRFAYGRNIVMVGSSGNSNSTAPHYPSGYSEVISVGNSTINDVRAPSSNYGSTLDLVAPGTQITTTTRNGEYTLSFNGTSAAAPFVSATAALILSLGGFTNEEVKQIIKSTCDDIDSPGWDIRTGAGRLNMHRAVSVLAPAKIKFNYPTQDFATFQDTLNINISVISPYFVKFDLYVGQGLNPSSWNALVTDMQNQVSGVNIHTLNLNSFAEGGYTLRLVVHLTNGSTTEERVNFYIDRTPPEILLIGDGALFYGEKSTVLAEMYTNKRCVTRMYYRKAGTNDFNFITLDAFATNNQFVKQFHYGFIPKQLVEPNTFYEVFYEAESMAGLKTTLYDEGGVLFLYKTDPVFSPVHYEELPFSLPRGTIHRDPVSFLSNNMDEILYNEFYPSNDIYYTLQKLEGNDFIRVDSVQNKIPRFAGDLNNNGRTELISSWQRSGYIDEQAAPGSFSFQNKLTVEDTLLPVLVTDTNGDGNHLLITNLRDTVLAAYRINNDLSISFITYLLNYSGIDSLEQGFEFVNYVYRNVVVADLNNDGVKEIWFADADGDLLSYNIISETNFVRGNALTTPFRSLNNNTMSVGDFDGDGIDDIAVLFRTPAIAPNFFLLVFNFKNNQPNIIFNRAFLDQSAEFMGFGFPRVFQSLRFADLDKDGKDELLLNIFPYVYIFKNNGDDADVIFYAEGVNSENIFIGDLNSNGVTEIGLQTPTGTHFYEFMPSLKPPVPFNVTAYSTDSTTIKLEWNGSGSKFYIYRGEAPGNIALIDSTNERIYFDTGLQTNKFYYYKLQAYDISKEIPYSNLTRTYEVYSHKPAYLTKAESSTANTVFVYFSDRVNNTIENLQAFEVLGVGTPNSVSAASQYSYLLTFNEMLPEADNVLIVKGLRDFYGSPVPEGTAVFRVIHIPPMGEFFISNHELLNPYLIKVQFNLSVDESSVSDIDNYTFEPENKASRIQIDAGEKNIVYVHLDGKKPVGSIGREYRMKIENVFSSLATGRIPINSGAGSYVVLTGFAKDLSDVYVYPSPVRLGSGVSKVTFANLPRKAKISILNLSGKKIFELEENDGDGGVDYHLKDFSGNLINSGIYIYRIISLDDSNNEIEEKLGKFAVIR